MWLSDNLLQGHGGNGALAVQSPFAERGPGQNPHLRCSTPSLPTAMKYAKASHHQSTGQQAHAFGPVARGGLSAGVNATWGYVEQSKPAPWHAVQVRVPGRSGPGRCPMRSRA